MTDVDRPTPKQIKQARNDAGITQAESAALVRAGSYRTWQDWESGRSKMHPGLWELFLIKTAK